MQALAGIALFLLLLWLLSEAKKSVPWRAVLLGLGLQMVLVYIFLHVEWVASALLLANHLVQAVETATQQGSAFLFGYLGGGTAPFEVTQSNAMYLFAFRVLPQVIVFSVLIAILWYWRVLPAIVRGLGWVLRRSLGVSGALGTAGAGSLFLGMVETPMIIRAYLASLSRAEMFCVMTFGMSTVAGSVMVLYAGVLGDMLPGVVGQILAASVLNVIGATYVARLMVPESEAQASTAAGTPSLSYASFMDAVSRGTSDGLQLAMNVGASLLVLISLVALANVLLSIISADLSLQQIFGWMFAPVAWLIGIPWAEAQTAGSLLGTKLVLNELVAYLQLVEVQQALSERSRQIMVYALCGFANFGSLGILLGGLLALCPERREETLKLAPKSLISGTVVTLISAAIVSLIAV